MKNEVMLFLERHPIRTFETEEIYLNRITDIAVRENLDLTDFFLVLSDKYPHCSNQIAELSSKLSAND
ncbi:hypothetical protein C9J03_03750 [Photobacterium gaetbulicola]|uniref:Uncharacterized protein n=1 Tax=Photobacterium gaetbulicola TaxID=1295392 RepID=A0A0B9G963_9GAMM|nr:MULTISPECIES: hypothetical protein [Photobacterium]KHT65129.1 hypothetical protein RJ45_02595 [Photobacterium gaetbulicola]PSU14032.1 hypothetical protein C9J03_03750 [Photobacterium gaetbulicola]WEM44863.1 hypothetical protein PTW35_26810 [Photobacterium sp. DA100]